MVSIENIINLKNIDKQEYVYNCDNNTKLKIIKINNIFNKMFVHYLYKSITKIPDKNWFSISGMENTKHEGKIINKNKKKIIISLKNHINYSVIISFHIRFTKQ